MEETKRLRLLYLPLLVSGGASEQYDLWQAFQKEYDVWMFDHLNHADPSNELIRIMAVFKPDIVHIQASDKLDIEVLESLKKQYPDTKFTQWTGDSRPYPIPYVVRYGKIMDATFLATGQGQKEQYEAVTGKPVFYWQHAVADWQFLPIPDEVERHGIVMACNFYDDLPLSDARRELAIRLSKEFEDFYVYGNGFTPNMRAGGRVEWRAAPALYNRSLITVGMSCMDKVEGYYSDRPLIAMASGTCHVTNYYPGAYQQFENNVDCVFYRGVDDAIELIKELIKNPQRRRAIGIAGLQKVRSEHMWSNRVQFYKEMVAKL